MYIHIHGLAETKMDRDLFGKENVNVTSFRSWNFTSQCLSCRNTDARDANQQLVLFIGQKEFYIYQVTESRDFFKFIY